MTTHLSTRLVWHDRAWDGHICDHPSKNASCVVQEHIRDGRDDDQEDKAAGVHLADLKTWQPPCARDPMAFANRGFTISHNDPLKFRQLPSVREEIPPYSVCPSCQSARHPQGILVRSKSEVIVADILTKLGVSFEYEQKFPSKDEPNDFKLPDFTVRYEGDTFYWEHLGMLSVPSYREAWNSKRQWYEDNGYFDKIITSENGPDGSIDAAEIERIARKQILMEG